MGVQDTKDQTSPSPRRAKPRKPRPSLIGLYRSTLRMILIIDVDKLVSETG